MSARVTLESVEVIADVGTGKVLGDIANASVAQSSGNLGGHVPGKRADARLDEAVLDASQNTADGRRER